MPVTTLDEWRDLIGDRRTVGYDLISEATGLANITLRGYNRDGRMPRSDGRGFWFADREDLALWVIGASRPGQGARTDLKKGNGEHV